MPARLRRPGNTRSPPTPAARRRPACCQPAPGACAITSLAFGAARLFPPGSCAGIAINLLRRSSQPAKSSHWHARSATDRPGSPGLRLDPAQVSTATLPSQGRRRRQRSSGQGGCRVHSGPLLTGASFVSVRVSVRRCRADAARSRACRRRMRPRQRRSQSGRTLPLMRGRSDRALHVAHWFSLHT
jgi:hypothetical protein